MIQLPFEKDSISCLVEMRSEGAGENPSMLLQLFMEENDGSVTRAVIGGGEKWTDSRSIL